MRYQNLIDKYDVTEEEIDDVLHQIKWGDICADTRVLLAVLDLCCNGDLPD